MPSPAASTAAAKSVFRRFRRNRRASAAVEFALVAPVFFALLFAIIETGIMFFANQVLETIAQDRRARLRPGKRRPNPSIRPQIRDHYCLLPVRHPSVHLRQYFRRCAKLFVFLARDHRQRDRCQRDFHPGTLDYHPGRRRQHCCGAAFYQWPLFVTGLGYNISNLSGNQRLLMATAVFQNEPFTAPVSDCNGRSMNTTVTDRVSNAPFRPGYVRGSQRNRGDRICRDRSADAGDVLWRGRIFFRRGGRPEGHADIENTIRSDGPIAVGRRSRHDEFLSGE